MTTTSPTIAPSTTDDATVLIQPADNAVARMVLNAAVATISARGYHGTSVRDIAVVAGVSPGTLYNYFGSKQTLLATLMCRAMDVLIEASRQALRAASPHPAARLDALVDAHVRVHAVSGRESLIGNSELRSLDSKHLRQVIGKRDEQQRLFDEVVADGVEQGLFQVADSRIAARYVVTACTAVAVWYRSQGGINVNELVRHYQNLSRQLLNCKERR